MGTKAPTTALHQNAFNVLGATARDKGARIVELAEERALLLDSQTCAKARTDLVTPRSRLGAEVAWLPGVSPHRAKDLLRGLQIDINLLKGGTAAIPHLAKANLVAGAFELLDPEVDTATWGEWIVEFARSVESIDAAEVLRDINEDRAVSGFPEVKTIDLVEAELAERRRYYRDTVKAALNRLAASKLVEVVTLATSSATENGAKHAPLLIDDVIDSYQNDADAPLRRGADNIKKLIDSVQSLASRGPEVLKPLIDSLDDALRKWNRLAKPIQLSMKARGLDHDLSRSLAFEVRSLGVDLFNKHDLSDVTRRITDTIRDIFVDLPEINQRVQEDSKALSEILDNRRKAELNRDAWIREITYEADIGAIFKDKLKISPEGLQWKNKVYPLDSVTQVRWGAISQSINGIPAGTTYKIAFGDEHSVAVVDLRRREVFQTFVDKLWRAVGVRLLSDLLEALKAGGRFSFGDAVIDDRGVSLTKHKFLGSEQVYVEWGKTHIWSANGSFFIGAKDDKKAYGSMSYLDTPNSHICEAVIRAAFEKGAIPLSNLLKGG